MKCPSCERAFAARTKFFPFCCARCQMADLGKWLDEEFRVSEPAGTADASAPGPVDAEGR